MPADFTSGDPRTAWQGQPLQPFRISPAMLEARVSRSRRRLRLLAATQRAGAVMGLLFAAAAIALAPDPAMRGSALILAIMFAGMLTFWFRPGAGARMTPSDGEPSSSFLRAELARHRDRDRGLRLWARLGLGMPAAIVFCLAFARAYPALSLFIYLEIAAIVIVLPIVFIAARRRSRRYDRDIAELDALRLDT